MTLRVLFMVVFLFAVAGCLTPEKKSGRKNKPAPTDMKSQEGDVSFQSFIGLLRKAAEARDTQMLATMMTENFGYRLDPPGEGEGVFQYWDENNLWGEVQSVLNKKFVAKGIFMVAPAEFVLDPNYTGYRAGVTWYGNSWKLAYFIKD